MFAKLYESTVAQGRTLRKQCKIKDAISRAVKTWRPDLYLVRENLVFSSLSPYLAGSKRHCPGKKILEYKLSNFFLFYALGGLVFASPLIVKHCDAFASKDFAGEASTLARVSISLLG